MIRCFLVPMTDPPYSRTNNQRPKYVQELQINWTGVPLFVSKMYVIKAAATSTKLDQLQASAGVLDFPNTDTDILRNLPVARRTKNTSIQTTLKITNNPDETVADFINRSANCEIQHNWRKDLVFVPDEQ